MEQRRVFAAAVPPAVAILVFGVIYGSLARPVIGSRATMLTSVLIFSGSVQFTIAALLTSGAATVPVIAGAMTLNLRNLVLGAVMRPRLGGSRWRRAAHAWFLTDEAVGLAITSQSQASGVLLTSGLMFYVSWQLGTLLGILGASLDQLADAASAVFPVLFIGLAALAAPSLSIALRAVVAAVVAGGAAWLWPGSEAIVAITAAIAVAIPERRP